MWRHAAVGRGSGQTLATPAPRPALRQPANAARPSADIWQRRAGPGLIEGTKWPAIMSGRLWIEGCEVEVIPEAGIAVATLPDGTRVGLAGAADVDEAAIARWLRGVLAERILPVAVAAGSKRARYA